MERKKILIIALDNIANTVYTIPMANVLKDYGFSVEYVVSEKGFSVINKNPKVNKVFLLSMEQWSGKWLSPDTWEAFFKVISRIKQREYDIVIDCQQNIRSLLIFALCVGRRKITYSDAKGFSSVGSNEVIRCGNHTENMVERNLNILRYLKIDYNGITFSLPETNYSFVLKNDRTFATLDKSKPVVVISAGARNENKRWSPLNWKTLIDRIKDKYNLVFTGSIMDEPFIKEIGGDGFLNLCGETRVETFIDILKRADIVITGETETAALAWAVQKPRVITLFTCSSPEKYSPIDYEDEKKYISLYGNLDCQPCESQVCIDNVAKCRKFPTVDDVIRAIHNYP
ncbi:MAG: glycosyltransferase family 9 protein [Candidatus Gastranaerophilales bacterium]|nr:glycosyltransferase family 9 protein [Candidatus Gastranaerophilales bacterium]